MLDIKFIRENTDIVKKSLKDRGVKADIDGLLKLDGQRRKAIIESEALKAERNKVSEEIGKLIKEKKDAKNRMASVKLISQKSRDFDAKVEELDQKIAKIVLEIPNITHSSVPVGPGPTANKIVRSWGDPGEHNAKLRNHLEIAEALGIIDFKRATKITGSNFPLFVGAGARLERALINFMVELHTKEHGYTEVSPPLLVNRASMTGTGQLPKLEEDMYRLKDDDLFLIPTAEVPVTNMYAGEILNEEDLPIYLTAYTPCFRREAGSYGKETKGLVRVHQFDKVEMVKFVHPDKSFDELETLLANAEEVLQKLGLPYRVVALSTGDISFSASKCYDIEAYAKASGAWLEVSSCSNFTDFQARRAGIKFRSAKSKKPEYIHTLNGSGIALARTVVAILENYQRPDGSVEIPEALRPYMGGDEAITGR